MRVTADTALLDVAPGDSGEVTLEVVNTGEVIEGVTARVIGIPEQHVVARPAVLPLFPDASGRLTLTLGLPTTYPAGRHPLTVEVSSRSATGAPTHVDVDLNVPARPGLALAARPELVRARRRGRFVLEIVNQGNVALDVDLTAEEAERATQVTFTPEHLTLQPGQVGSSVVAVRGPRLLFGSELDRPLTVRATSEGIERDAALTLRQRPMVARGVLTALILCSIIGLWAAAFLFGLGRVMAGDPLTKTAPASFFASSAASRGDLVANGQPAGLPAKGGAVDPGVGGIVTGKVTAVSTGQGLGRIVVEALRQTPKGLALVSSAATQADGTYSIPGLFPGQYLLRFTATGYTPVWFPAATAAGSAKEVSVAPGDPTGGIDVRMAGLPATIRGSIDPGDTLKPVTATVVARALDTTGTGAAPTVKTRTKPDGSYVLAKLPSPATYELSFTADGYSPTTVVEKVRGGQERFEPTVRLSAGAGSISGVVTDGRNPLGGVTVTTTVDGKDASTATPTTGTVGHFSLPGLTTPATYVVTFTKDGFAPQTVVVDLGPGQRVDTLEIALVGGTGTVTGRLVDAAGQGVGGAKVTVGGVAQAAETTTLTTGDIGLFAVSGLPVPGSYTLTFTKPGYQPQTVPLQLDPKKAPEPLTVTLTPALGSVSGRVTGPDGTGLVGATVTANDGSHTWKVTTVGGAAPGAYRLSDLAPGSYTLTVAAKGMAPRSALVTVTAGSGTAQDVQLQKAG